MINLLLNFLIIFSITGLLVTFLGYWIHWTIHQPWSLWFYNAHMNHHKIQYPATEFFSDTYKSAGRDSTVILFAIIFTPVFIGLGLLAFFGTISLTTLISIVIGSAVWGWAHNYFHDQFHLTNSFWKRFSFFLNFRKLHYIHHLDMRTNFGIIIFSWDRLFKSFANEDIELH